jgi:non-canonical (house-cleaning) NTP pyrophosphatase
MSPVTVVLGSTNPAKLRALEEVVARILPGAEVVGVDVASGVAEQPRSDVEALRGAEQRGRAAIAARPANYGVGLESGVADFDGGLFCFTWAAVIAARRCGLQVAASKQEDMGKGIVRLSRRAFEELGASEGDVIEIRGKRTTAAIALSPTRRTRGSS